MKINYCGGIMNRELEDKLGMMQPDYTLYMILMYVRTNIVTKIKLGLPLNDIEKEVNEYDIEQRGFIKDDKRRST
jgi:hypothetical protein